MDFKLWAIRCRQPGLYWAVTMNLAFIVIDTLGVATAFTFSVMVCNFFLILICAPQYKPLCGTCPYRLSYPPKIVSEFTKNNTLGLMMADVARLLSTAYNVTWLFGVLG